VKAAPWRSLYLRHACAVCFDAGDFCARDIRNGPAVFLLCGRCARSEPGRQKLVAGNLQVDVTSISGKALYTSRRDKFISSLHTEGLKSGEQGTRALLFQQLAGRKRRR